ncbi:MAG: hypothetical protein HYY04_16255 [Chloroflexi bacterium]|nr:hypothetical protein [Chloroflexota bacterium]
MIDVHAHILPGIDDGADSLAQSVEMARVAATDGVAGLVATPHCSNWAFTGGIVEIQRLAGEVQTALDEEQIPVRVLSGSEAYFGPELIGEVARGLAPTLNGSRYLLAELPLQQSILRFADLLFQLQVRGIVVILAHVERYTFVQERPEAVIELAQRGVVLQVNASSLIGVPGSRPRATAELLLRHNLAHLLASDAHSPVQRPPRLSEGVTAAAALIGGEAARSLVETVPRAIVEDAEINLPEPLPIKRRAFWEFWRWSP